MEQDGSTTGQDSEHSMRATKSSSLPFVAGRVQGTGSSPRVTSPGRHQLQEQSLQGDHHPHFVAAFVLHKELKRRAHGWDPHAVPGSMEVFAQCHPMLVLPGSLSQPCHHAG